MHEFMYACVRVCVYACMRVCVHACMCVCAYACMYVYVYASMCNMLFAICYLLYAVCYMLYARASGGGFLCGAMRVFPGVTSATALVVGVRVPEAMWPIGSARASPLVSQFVLGFLRPAVFAVHLLSPMPLLYSLRVFKVMPCPCDLLAQLDFEANIVPLQLRLPSIAHAGGTAVHGRLSNPGMAGSCLYVWVKRPRSLEVLVKLTKIIRITLHIR